MKRRYRAPILWSGLGAVVVLAYVLSQPVPIPIDGYRAPGPAATPEATTAGVITADAAATTQPVAADVAAAPAATEPPPAAAMPAEAPAVTPPAAPVVATVVPPSATLYVSATSLNLRAAPAAGAAVLELLPRGTRVNAVGAVEGWHEVINPATGTQGWMSAEYLTATPPGATAATTPPPAPATPATAPALLLVP